MPASTRYFAAFLIVWAMTLITHATIAVFSADLTQLSAATATAYGAVVGIPGAGMYGLYKLGVRNREGKQ